MNGRQRRKQRDDEFSIVRVIISHKYRGGRYGLACRGLTLDHRNNKDTIGKVLKFLIVVHDL